MNRQETYEKVRDHLLKQGVASETIDGCQYRGPNGLKCAIGCLIPDDLYRTEMEGCTADDGELGAVREYLEVEDGNDEGFLCDLQAIHDEKRPDAWRNSLEWFALEHGLQP